jgi:hypothetical protein
MGIQNPYIEEERTTQWPREEERTSQWPTETSTNNDLQNIHIKLKVD